MREMDGVLPHYFESVWSREGGNQGYGIIDGENLPKQSVIWEPSGWMPPVRYLEEASCYLEHAGNPSLKIWSFLKIVVCTSRIPF